MPLPTLTRRSGRRLVLTLSAQTRSTERLVLTLRAQTVPVGYRLTLALRAQTQPDPSRTLTLVLHAQTNRVASGGTGAPVQEPREGLVEILLGAAPFRSRTRLLLDGEPLDGLSWQHTRQAAYAEAEFTVRGVVRPAIDAVMRVEVTQLLPTGQLVVTQYEPVPASGDYTVTTSPDGGHATVFRGRSRQDEQLQNTQLDELIPWVKNPSRQIESPGYRSVTRQIMAVDAVALAAFGDAGQNLSGTEMLQGEYWEETRREYSTEGRSPLDVFGDTYGRLNALLVLENTEQPNWVVVPAGLYEGVRQLDPTLLTGLSEQAEVTGQPSRLTLQVGDLFTRVEDYLEEVVESGTLPDVMGEDGEPVQLEIADPEAALFEVKRDAVLTGYADRDGRRTAHLTRKIGGRVVQTLEVTVGALEVTEQVVADSEETQRRIREARLRHPYFTGMVVHARQRRLENVVLSVIETWYAYLPGSTDSQALAETVTTQTAYTCTYTTITAPATLPAELAALLPGAVMGDLLGQESTRIRNVWSPQGGWLRERLTVESRVGELGQSGLGDPDEPPPPPKAMTVEEYSTAETYAPSGDGYWLYTRTRTGPQKLPVRDLDTDEFVKTERRVGVLEHNSEITENAPPTLREEVPPVAAQAGGTPEGETDPESYSGLPWPRITYLRDPQEVSLPLGGPAPAQTAQLEVVQELDRASSLAAVLARSLRPRVTRRVSTPEAQALRPALLLPGLGIVTLVTARGQGQSHTLEVETVTYDD
ncbi:hypothetical protein GO986_09070 [Deinococcus sp. HMF7620]|uniref:Uncharacterized protein n=1 Tax=Deinococcus arboris TaxID=2682977 RepID=A0A7C9HZD0_9DEIO|nr:hypothetical protein [Deinococcus arboris]MVN86915.1 hypothetical protein [Deinococcus arboris]